MITFYYEGRGVLADDYVIKDVPIFYKFSPNSVLIFKIFSNSDAQIKTG